MSLSHEQGLLRGNYDTGSIQFDKHTAKISVYFKSENLRLYNLVIVFLLMVGFSLEHASWNTIITDFTRTLILISLILSLNLNLLQSGKDIEFDVSLFLTQLFINDQSLLLGLVLI